MGHADYYPCVCVCGGGGGGSGFYQPMGPTGKVAHVLNAEGEVDQRGWGVTWVVYRIGQINYLNLRQQVQYRID